ncbi:hypothetical protein EHQ86_18665 [Leptospira yasudae]|nr:hypothetical protein EHQ86_18665 [Leptospira yasudae]
MDNISNKIQKDLVNSFSNAIGVKGDLFSWSGLEIKSKEKALKLEFVIRFDQWDESNVRFWKRVFPVIEKFKDYHSDENVEHSTFE